MLCLFAQAVKVNALGKWKTALQMTAMSLLLFGRDDTVVPSIWAGASCPLLAASSVVSGV
jgi:phosphatidylglycerophosphate synthase